MSAPAGCKLVGRWRIVEADRGARAYLNLSGPATITTRLVARSPSARSKPTSTSNTSQSAIGFTWQGCDEMDEASGDGSAELLDDGTIEVEFAYTGG